MAPRRPARGSAPAGEGGLPGLEDPLQGLPGVGPRRAELLARLGIRSPLDLLFTVPRTYLDRTRIVPVAELEPGSTAVVQVRVERCAVRRRRGGRADTLLRVADGSGTLAVVFWGQSYRARSFASGMELLLAGPVDRYGRELTMSSPEVTRLAAGSEPELGWLPLYPLTEGIQQGFLRDLVVLALHRYAGSLPEVVPPALSSELGLEPLAQAVASVHRPASLAAAAAGRRRLALEELFVLQVAMAARRLARGERRTAIQAEPGPRFERARAALPFALTADQRTALTDILRDLARPTPMHRLLEGDVGSGKTVVALLAAMAMIDSGHQVAIMAPTEILALQHARVVLQLLPGVAPVILTGSTGERERRQALAA
ncbi:MAG TPA: DEAD/DEAH box helicase, partial [Candidatus Udaeobacter sp.]|nr:DEAD/DEAH box helicase [Candidatus Udaeobacter sp.]